MLPRTPSLFEMQTMGYGFRGVHVGGPQGATPRLESCAKNDTREYRVDVPPCPSPRIQTQDPMNTGTAPWSTSADVPRDDDQAQASHYNPMGREC